MQTSDGEFIFFEELLPLSLSSGVKFVVGTSAATTFSEKCPLASLIGMKFGAVLYCTWFGPLDNQGISISLCL